MAHCRHGALARRLRCALWTASAAKSDAAIPRALTTLLLCERAIFPSVRADAGFCNPNCVRNWSASANWNCAGVARGALGASAAVRRQASREYSVAQNLTRLTQQVGREKSRSTFMYLVAMVVGVVGVTYASVPLYRRFCQATGYGGTVQRRETVEEKIARHGTEDVSRELVVHFNADIADSMPWKFSPCQNQVRVKVGQSALAFYTAENTSGEDITGVSTYNVAPMQAGAYFNKIQCFCFEEQRLRAGEKLDMPVLFYIDPEFASDPKMDSINSLILSYTFFRVDDDDEEE